jgi:histone-lysine N-methyltransferase SETMAR
MASFFVNLCFAYDVKTMSLSRTQFRAVLLSDFKRGLTCKQSHENLVKAFGQEAPSLRTVERWFSSFSRKQWSLEDKSRSGRPATAVTRRNVERIDQLIKDRRNATYHDMQRTCGIGAAATNRILHQRLGVRKLASRWIPHSLSDEQKKQRVKWCRFMLKTFEEGRSKRVAEIVTGDETWIYSYDPETKQQSTVWVFGSERPPTKVVRDKSTSKKMVAVFFRRKGPVAAIPLKERRTVNAEWYTTVCLPAVFERLKKERPKAGLRRILLHHDNAPAHTASRTITFLDATEVELIGHPPYSPDLAPCDFFLFPELKKRLRGKRFDDPEDAVAEMNDQLKRMPKEAFKECFDKWFERMKKCISVKGDYFEKL